MKKELFYTIALIIPILLLLSFPAWPVPGLINYQGKLTDPNGTSLNGSYTMKFYLYNAESDGSLLWNEQQDVTVTNGIYNVELGKISSFPSDLFDNENLYLEVEIFSTGMGWETLSPRQRITSTPFAMKAGYATTAGNADMVDGFQGSELEESAEINNKIALHVQDTSAHHLKTTSFTDLTDTVNDDQIPDDITVNYAKDADKVDGKHASEFGDGHSLDAADGSSTDVMYVDNVGNVGVGTTSPVRKLDVRGHLVLNTDSASPFESGGELVLANGDPTTTPIWLIDTDGRFNRFRLCYQQNINVVGFEVLTASNNGNIGIGIRDPAGRLHVNGLGDYNNASGIEDDLVVTTGGNVGIGTTSPAEKLHVYGTDMAIVEIESGNDYPAQLYLKGDGVKWAIAKRWGAQNDRLGFYYHDGETWSSGLLTLETSGNVGIGITSPAEKLHVYGTDAPIIAQIECNSDNTAQIELKGDGVKWAMSKRRGPENDRLGFYYHDGASWSPGLLTLEPSGNVGIGTESPQQKMHISGVMRLEPQSSPPSGALGDLYVGTDGNLYFHNGTEWKEVSLI